MAAHQGLDGEADDSSRFARAAHVQLDSVVQIEVAGAADARHAEDLATAVALRLAVAVDDHPERCLRAAELRGVDAVVE